MRIRFAGIRRLLPHFEALAAVVLWGGSFIATKLALRDVSPVTVVWLRFAIGTLILGAAVLARREFSLPSARDLSYFTLLGFVGITFHQWLQSNGLVTAQVVTSAWIVATTPVFIALLAWAMLREGIGLKHAGGILLAAMGALLVISKGDFKALTGGEAVTRGSAGRPTKFDSSGNGGDMKGDADKPRMDADLKGWESVCKGRWGALEAVPLADDAANAVDGRSYLGLLARARRNIGQEDRAAHCAALQGHPKRPIELCPRSSASMGKCSF